MDKLLPLLVVVGNLSAIAVAIAAALAFIPHTFVNEWIKTRFARQVERESREHTARLQRELEEYKNALLRQLDEARLDIDLRRGIALQSAAASLDAIRKLSVSLVEHVTFALAFPQLPPPQRALSHEPLVKKAADVMAARLEADIFLDPATSVESLKVFRDAHALAAEFMDGRPAITAAEPRIEAITTRLGAASNKLRDAFQALVKTGRAIP